MKTETMKYIRTLRHKRTKANEEIAFLEMYKILFKICDVLVEESKWHLTSEQAIERIREHMSDLNYI